MRTVSGKHLSRIVNLAYQEYNADPSNDLVISFANHVKRKYGIKLNFIPARSPDGKSGYELQSVTVLDEAKYSWLLLEYSHVI